VIAIQYMFFIIRRIFKVSTYELNCMFLWRWLALLAFFFVIQKLEYVHL
jgi:hypothetical protein